MISVRFPYALTSQAELGFNALDAFEGLSETDIHHIVIRHSLVKLLDMQFISITDSTTDILNYHLAQAVRSKAPL